MTRSAAAIVPTLLLILVVLALNPAHVRSDVPVVATVVPTSAFRRLGLEAAGQGDAALGGAGAAVAPAVDGCPALDAASACRLPAHLDSEFHAGVGEHSGLVGGEVIRVRAEFHSASSLLRLSTVSVTPLSTPTPRPAPVASSPVGAPGSSPAPVRSPAAPSTGVPSSPAAAVSGAVQRGTASTYGPAFGPGWLAVPQGPGVQVRICGAARCIERTSTDAGPDLAMQRLGRIVDLSVRDFELVTGLSWTRGLAPVSVEYLP